MRCSSLPYLLFFSFRRLRLNAKCENRIVHPATFLYRLWQEPAQQIRHSQAARHPPKLHIVGCFQCKAVSDLDLAEREQIVRLRSSVRHFNVVDGRARIERSQPLAQLDGAVRLTVAKWDIEEAFEVEPHL